MIVSLGQNVDVRAKVSHEYINLTTYRGKRHIRERASLLGIAKVKRSEGNTLIPHL